jgi:regulatory protein
LETFWADDAHWCIFSPSGPRSVFGVSFSDQQSCSLAMAKRSIPGPVAAKVLDRFEDVGLVNDAAFAEMLVRTRHTERGLAGSALVQELRRRGVDNATARAAVAAITPEAEADRAQELAARRLAGTRALPRETRVRRAYAHLARKGYGPDTARRAINAALDQEEPAENQAG